MQRSAEFEETLWRFRQDINSTKRILSVFSVVAVLINVFVVDIPLSIFVTILFWLGSHLFRVRFLNSKKRVKQLYRAYFFFNVIDFVFLTFIAYVLGVVDWMGPVFFLITLAMSGLLLPKKRVILLSLIAFFFYAGLICLEYFGVLPYRSLFPSLGLERGPYFAVIQVVVTGLLFYFMGDVTGSFSETLRKRSEELAKERKKAKEALFRSREMEKILKVRVRARTRELRELAERQEDIIEERTRELEKRVGELEKFRKLTVGREMKMIRLKKEKEKMKKRIKRLKNKDK